MRERERDLERIASALETARSVLGSRPMTAWRAWSKADGDPVTDADTTVDAALRARLPATGEGWLSEESADDLRRLDCPRVWVVDPLDGTRHFVSGIPEWAVSVALVEQGRAVAGGVWIGGSDTMILGAEGCGVNVDGVAARIRETATLDGANVLASRSEFAGGEWDRYRDAPFRVRPLGSVAAKLALVAVGRADATWTWRSRHEWDVAAGVALVLAAGGDVWLPGGGEPRFNRPQPVLPGLFATPRALGGELRAWLAEA